MCREKQTGRETQTRCKVRTTGAQQMKTPQTVMNRYSSETSQKQAPEQTAEAMAARLAELEARVQSLENQLAQRDATIARLELAQRHTQTIVQSVQAALFLVDLQTEQLLYMSPAYQDLYAQQADARQTIPLAFLDAIHPDDRARMEAAIRRQREGHATAVEYRVVGPDKRVRWLADSAYPIFDESGKPVLVAGIVQDVSVRKEIEEDLHHRISMGRMVARISSEIGNCPFEEIDAKITLALGELGRFVRADRTYVVRYDAGQQFLHKTHEWCAPGIPTTRQDSPVIPVATIPWLDREARHSDVLTILHAGELPPHAVQERAIFAAQGVEGMMLVAIHVDGRIIGYLGFERLAKPLDDPQRATDVLVFLGDAIAAALRRRDADQALRDSAAYNRALIDAIPDTILVIDAKGTYCDIRPDPDLIRPVDPNSFIGLTLWDYFEQTTADFLFEKLETARRTGKVQSFDYVVPHGRSMEYREARAVAFAEDRVLSVVRDVTRRTEQTREVEALAHISQLCLQATRSPLQLIQEVLTYVCAQLHFSHGSLVWWNPVTDAIELQLPTAAADCKITPLTETLTEVIGGQALTTHDPIFWATIPLGTIAGMTDDAAQDLSDYTAAAVPILFNQEQYGALVLSRQGDQRLLPSLQQTLTSIANMVAQTIYRYNTEQARAASEAKFATAFYVLPDALAIIRQRDYLLLDANFGFEQLTGLRREEVIGLTIADALTGDERTLFNAITETLTDVGRLHNQDCPFTHASGSSAHALLSVEAIDVDGEPCWLAIGKDIGDRIAMEESLRRSQQSYQLVFDQASDSIFLADAEGHYVDVNGSACTMLGYTRAELLQLSISQLIAPENLHALPPRLDILQSGQTTLTERILVRKDGTRLPVEISGKLLDDGRLLGIVRDISQRKAEELAQQRYTVTLEALSQTSLALASLDNHDATLTTILDYAITLLRYDFGGLYLADEERDELILARVQNPRHVKLGERVRPGQGLVGRVFATGDLLTIEDYDNWPNRRADVPKGLIGSVIGVPLKQDAKTIGVLYISRDQSGPVTQDDLRLLTLLGAQAALAIERVRLLDSLRQSNLALAAERAQLAARVAKRTEELSMSNSELARALRMKDEFMASMSHELRTPLSTILLLTQMLARGMYGAITDRQLKTLQTLERSGNHLLTLINDILDISKIEAGKLTIDLAPVALEAVCRESVEVVRAMADDKDLSLDYQFGDRTIVLNADERRLKQILINLLSNAVKFTPVQGRIGLEVTADANGRAIHICVWDTGIGIAQHDIPRLFRPFVQLDSGLDRQHEGTGLGLALVYRMVEMHGGSIQVDSQEGAGSRFTISLPWSDLLTEAAPNSAASVQSALEPPASAEQSPLGAAAPNAHLQNQPGPLVLVADDNAPTIQAIVPFLMHHGYRVITAPNGVQAVFLARRHKPDLILMDIQMPELDGLSATRRLCADPALSDTAIIALTALAMVGDRERCLDAGAVAYLSKPINLDQLLDLLAQHTKRDTPP